MTMFTTILFKELPSGLFQDAGPMSGMSGFQESYYNGLWLLFFLIALAALVWVYYDSQRRKLMATIWRICGFIAVGLLLPTLLFKFTVRPSEINTYYELKDKIAWAERYQQGLWQDEVDAYQILIDELPVMVGGSEMILYLGVLGGLGGLALAVAYYVNYKGMVGNDQGFTVIDQGQFVGGQSPYQPNAGYPAPPPPPVQSYSNPSSHSQAPVSTPMPSKPKVSAWLVSREGRNFQLNRGETILGRSSRNDIKIDGDTTVSKQHAKIVESNGHFKLYDLGSSNGTRLNKQRLRQPMLLQSDDEIQLGDNTFLRFKK